jgi:hypothetical protein
LEKCLIIIKTYRLCRGVNFNGPTKSKFHLYPSPIIGKGCKWGVGVDAWTWSHTIHLETNCWTCNCIPRHQYCVWSKSVGPQNGPIPHEHAS